MPLAALALVLSAAVLHAAWNLWAKQIGPGTRSGTLMFLLVAISSVAYAPFALVNTARAGWHPDARALLLIAGSGVIHVGYFLLLLRGYRFGDLSLVYPVARGTGPLLASLAALVVFGERPTAFSIGGLLLITTGIAVLLVWPAGGRGRGFAPGLGYGIATGVLIALYTLWDGWAVKRAGLPPLVFYWGGEVVRVLLFAPAGLADREGLASLWRTSRGRVLGIALLSPLAYILTLAALRIAPVSHVAPAREVSILLGAWLGGRVLGEGERTRRVVAAAAFVAGVIALALA